MEEDDDDDDEKPAGFPQEEFEHFICWACVEKNPWLKRYSGTPGFLLGAYRKDTTSNDPNIELTTQTKAINGNAIEEGGLASTTENDAAPQEQAATETVLTADRKRKASEDPEISSSKRAKTPDAATSLNTTSASAPNCKLAALAPAFPSKDQLSLFLHADFRSHLCRCTNCYPLLARHRCLLEEEETYSPPLDKSDHEGSVHSGSTLLDQGERALGMMDRVQAIEGLMAYNHLKDKVRSFLKPYAESGQEVKAEDVKDYFEKLRGDRAPKKDNGEGVKGDGRKEGEGY